MLPVWALAQGGGPGWDGQPSKRWVREEIASSTAICTNAANLRGPVPDASIATNTPSASSGMLLAWNKAGERFWKWVNMLRNSAGTIALDASTAGILNVQGNIILGGGGTNSYVTIQGTSGNGALTLPAFQVAVGNNGARKALTILNNGRVGQNITSPAWAWDILGTGGDALSAAMHTFIPSNGGLLLGYSGATIQGRNSSDGNGNLSINPFGGDILFPGSGVWKSSGNVCIMTNTAPTSVSLRVRGNSILGTMSNTTWAANQTFPAGQLANNVPYANVTSALARARAPQGITYTGTNVYTDARQGGFYRINATNDFRMNAPTGATDGQTVRWWIKQHVGGTNTMSFATADWVLPDGASGWPTLGVTNGCVDDFLATWDAVVGVWRINSYERFKR
jgi:hypothetical protein